MREKVSSGVRKRAICLLIASTMVFPGAMGALMQTAEHRTQSQPGMTRTGDIDSNGMTLWKGDSRAAGNHSWSPDILLSESNGTDYYPSISVDARNNIHLAWISYDKPGEASIAYRRSTTDGMNWQAIQYITCPVSAPAIYWVETSANGNGTVDIAYWPYLYRMVEQPIYHFRSNDSGTTWSNQVVVGFVKPLNFNLISNASEAYILTPPYWNNSGCLYKGNFPGQTWAYIYHEPSQYNYTWATDTLALTKNGIHALGKVNGENLFRHYISSDNAITWSGGEIISSSDFTPLEVADNETSLVYLGLCNNKTMLGFVWSNDEGRTWNGPVAVANLTSVSTFVGPQYSITVDSKGVAHFVWQDTVNGDWEIFYANASLATGSVSEAVRLTDSIGYSMNPDIAVDKNGYIQVVWSDNRTGYEGVYYKRYPSEDITPPQIERTPVLNADTNTPIQIAATATDNVGIENCFLYYKGQRFDDYICTEMNITNGSTSDGNWQAAIPPQITNRSIQYYIQATDSSGNTVKLPAIGFYEVDINDTIPVALSFNPVNATHVGLPITIFVNASDNFQVSWVCLNYREINETIDRVINMTLYLGTYRNGTWYAVISPFAYNTTILYHITAVDENGNYAILPFNSSYTQYSMEILNVESSSSSQPSDSIYLFLIISIVCAVSLSIIGLSLRKYNRRQK